MAKDQADTVLALPMCKVRPDPSQPRKLIDAADIVELAASIRENGLLQPILVRPDRGVGYIIVAGERRYRAHEHNKAETILGIVRDMVPSDVFVAQIVENLQRRDISPLEEAVAYQRLVDEMGGDINAAATRIGIMAYRITERTGLLNLREEYRTLLAAKQLKPSEAQEMSHLSPGNQDKLFRLIRTGQCSSYAKLRAASVALRGAEAQTSLLGPEEAAPPSEAEIETATRLERKIDQIVSLTAAGFDDNEIIVARKVNPGRATTYADKLALIQKHVCQMELSLRAIAAVNSDLLAA